jgi:PAS domain S-box-containing protein
VLLAASLLLQSISAAPIKEIRRVLLLYPMSPSPTIAVIDRQVRDILEESPYQIEFYTEYMDTNLFPDEHSQEGFRKWYIHKYRDRKPDMVVAVASGPIRFMIDAHERYFRSVPIVFCCADEEQIGDSKPDSDFTGVWTTLEPLRTVETALRLQPDTKHIVVVSGAAASDRHLEVLVRKSVASYAGKIEFTYLSGLDMPTLLEQLKHLPKRSAVLYVNIERDASGKHFMSATQALPMITSVANAPVFVMADMLVGQGSVGGYVTNFAYQGKLSAAVAVRILKGEKPKDIPIAGDANVYMFDWRALRRWGFRESDLPPGSIVLNRLPTAWESYRRYIIGFVCLCFVETLLVFGLLWQRVRRRKVEESLFERLTFETLLSDLSTTFINLPEERVASNLDESLGRMGAFLQMDRITLYEFSQDRAEWAESFTWTKEGAQAGRAVMKAAQLPWWTERTMRGELLVISSLDELPDEAATERNFLRAKEIISAASVPLEVGGEVFGGMTFASTARRLLWSEDLVQRLKMLAEIFSNALGRKHAEARRRESEERFRLVANTAPVLIWMSGIDMSCTYLNQGWLDFTGRTLQDELGSGWEEGIYPLDLRRCKEIHRKAFENRERFTVEFRLRRHDGQFRWVLDIGVPRFNADGSFAGYIGSVIDVTDHKEAEQALATVSGRLIQAQEEERHRIARELHDDISQRLALLSVELQTLANDRPKSSVEFRERTEQLLKRTSQISSDIHALSHRLHSSKLDYMGAVAAMAGFCSEMTAQTGSEIEFVHTNVPKTLPQDISLCLFRVLQEGLRNAITYSGAQHFKVELGGTPGAILLVIRDSGAGFDPETAMKNGGLGLISMRERVSLVKGTISITSRPMVGTEIRVQIPFVQAQAACASQMSIPSVEEVYGTSEDKDLAGR